MFRLRSLLVIVAAVGALAWAAAPATAALNPVVADCLAHNRLTHDYSVAQLRAGLDAIPVNDQEYGPCGGIISNAIYAKLHYRDSLKSGGTGGSSSGLIVVIVVVVVLIVLAGGGLALRSARQRREPS